MNGYQEAGITSGIGQGLDKAVSNILNLYGLKQRFDLQQQGLAIDKQNADSYKQEADTRKRRSLLKYFGSSHHWDTANLSKFHQPQGAPSGSEPDFRVPQQYTLDPRYQQAGADALRD